LSTAAIVTRLKVDFNPWAFIDVQESNGIVAREFSAKAGFPSIGLVALFI
jgi:hypothetical protein